MKLKIALIFLLFGLLINPARAQKSDFRFGLKATPTLVWLKPDSKGFESDGTKLTFSWGFMAEYYFADNYAIASGIDVVSRGGKIRILDTIQVDYKLKYIDLPITIKMRTNEIGYMRYFAQFGFTPGVNISAKADIENVAEDENIKSDIVPVNVALYVGAGIEYSFGGNTSLVVSAAFNNGFVDIAKDSDEGGDFKVISNYVGLNVGVLF